MSDGMLTHSRIFIESYVARIIFLALLIVTILIVASLASSGTVRGEFDDAVENWTNDEGGNVNNEVPGVDIENQHTPPYYTASGPITENLTVNGEANPSASFSIPSVNLTALGNDTALNVLAGEYFLESPGSNGTGTPLSPLDGAFDSQNEFGYAVISNPGWAPGENVTIYVHFNNTDAWGDFATINLTITDDAKPTTEDTMANGSTSLNLGWSQGWFELTSLINDTASGNSNITQAEYFVDSTGANGTGNAMFATDGDFNTSLEEVNATIMTQGWNVGDTFTYYVHGMDSWGNWGDFQTVSVTIVDDSPPVAENITINGNLGDAVLTYPFINVEFRAAINDTLFGGSNVTQAEVFWDAFTGDGTGIPLSIVTPPADSPIEEFNYTFDADSWSYGEERTLLAHGFDGFNWGTLVSINVTVLGLDYVIITDVPDGNPLEMVNLTVEDEIGLCASGYNATNDAYVGLVEVDWTDSPDGGNFSNATGTRTNFTATIPGLVNVTAENATLNVTDLVAFNISSAYIPPVMDLVMITDAFNGTVVDLWNLSVLENKNLYLSGYNATTGIYMGPAWGNWSMDVALGTLSNATGTNVTFTAGTSGGDVVMTALNGTFEDNATLSITPQQVDLLEITESPGGTPIPAMTFAMTVAVNYSITGYASGYNSTTGDYVGLVDSTWILANTAGASANISTTSGTECVFNAGMTGGTAEWVVDDMSSITDFVLIFITPPAIDTLLITDSPGGTEIPDQDGWVGMPSMTGYASIYNDTVGYIGVTYSTWQVINNGSTASTSGGHFSSNTFTAGTSGGTATWQVQGPSLECTDTVVFAIAPPETDYILMTDVPDGSQVADFDAWVGMPGYTAYASTYNDTAGYLGTVASEWTVENLNGATTSTEVGFGTSDAFNAGYTGGSAVWTVDDLHGHNDSVIVSIAPPEVDFVEISDAPSSNELPSIYAWLGMEDITFVLNGFNATAGPLGLVDGDWSVINIGGSATSLSESAGNSTELTIGSSPGTATVSARYAKGISDDVTVYIAPPEPDYMETRDGTGPDAQTVDVLEIPVGEARSVYVSVHNHTSGYIENVEADVSSSPMTLNASVANLEHELRAPSDDWGETIAVFTYLSLEVGLDVTVMDPEVDIVLIRTEPGEDGEEIISLELKERKEITVYAAGYNATTGFVSNVVVDWTATGGELDKVRDISTTYKAGSDAGIHTISAEYVPGVSTESQITIKKVEEDTARYSWIWIVILVLVLILILAFVWYFTKDQRAATRGSKGEGEDGKKEKKSEGDRPLEIPGNDPDAEETISTGGEGGLDLEE